MDLTICGNHPDRWVRVFRAISSIQALILGFEIIGFGIEATQRHSDTATQRHSDKYTPHQLCTAMRTLNTTIQWYSIAAMRRPPRHLRLEADE
eukprot:1761833-Pyramimonas_sp.AAC.1